MAGALRTSHIEKGDRTALDLNFSEYKGEYGMAGSLGMRFSDTVQIHIAGATTSEFKDRIVKNRNEHTLVEN